MVVEMGTWDVCDNAIVYYCGKKKHKKLCGHVFVPECLLKQVERVIISYDVIEKRMVAHFQ